ncbi:TlpA family protein disulfide reductase [Bacillus sp. V3-13]|uniref:TlpA family protein disulfide reductase n=1 Tax=Bacillus sp. V3-13 TaxID=2053728 RepID=UPI000C78E154|nr:TlpA disulfide reductase family protein [Bacillus sp. V3-13]PLR79460.1 TlpA family protein disulfide reductase [Bacillus sp. V3-13]
MVKKLVPVIVIIVAFAIIGMLVSGLSGKASANPGDKAAEFELQTVTGETYKLADYKGRKVVLNFFTTWCQPCLDEAPELEAFGAEYGGAELLIIAKGETKKRIEDYLKDSNSQLTYLLDTKEEVSKNYSVIGQPETIIIDENGIIQQRFSGPTTKDKLIDLIENPALNDK